MAKLTPEQRELNESRELLRVSIRAVRTASLALVISLAVLILNLWRTYG